MQRCRIFLVSCALLLGWQSSHADDNETRGTAASNTQVSGYAHVRRFGGPAGVAEALARTYPDREATVKDSAIQRGFKLYFDWKQRIIDEHGFSFGFNAYWLHQKTSESQGDEGDAFGQAYHLQGAWHLFGRGTEHPDKIEWRIEHRSAIGSNLAPTELSGEIGMASLNTGFPYNPGFDWDLAVFNWTQILNHETAGFAVGRLAFDVYLDAFAFQTVSRGLVNRPFVLNPAAATTDIDALGAVAKGFVTDSIWSGGQISDGNAVNGQFDMDTFDEGEWLKAVEIGWAPTIDRFKTDRIRFTWRDKDARGKAGVPEEKGWAISANWKLDKFFPFARFGHSDGGPVWPPRAPLLWVSNTPFDPTRPGLQGSAGSGPRREKLKRCGTSMPSKPLIKFSCFSASH